MTYFCGKRFFLKSVWEISSNYTTMKLTKEEELRSGQNDSGIGQNPTAKPFCAERGT
jgi:hypothetical protein